MFDTEYLVNLVLGEWEGEGEGEGGIVSHPATILE